MPWVKKTYIPYGVDREKFNQSPPAMVNLKKPIVLCVSAFSPYKRIDLLIRAMQKVPQASLLIIGQGLLEGELRRLGENLLGDRFRLVTEINHDQLIGYYKASDVFSLPSKSTEALGIVYLEAMAAGLPVVAPDDFNRREILGKAGIYVNPEDIEAYAEGIKKAINEKLGVKPENQAHKFSWEKILSQYEQILQKIIKK